MITNNIGKIKTIEIKCNNNENQLSLSYEHNGEIISISILNIGKYWLEIQYLESKLGGYNFLFICENGIGPEKALDYSGGYLHGDFNCYIHAADREEIVFFAENITEILEKFTVKWKKQETRFTKALEKINKFEEKEKEK